MMRGSTSTHSLILWSLGCAVACAATVVITLSVNATIGLAALAACLALPFFALPPVARTSAIYAIGVLLIVAASSTTASSSEYAGLISIGLRLLGFIILIRTGMHGLGKSPHSLLRARDNRWLIALALGQTLYFLIGAGAHRQFTDLALYMAGLALLICAGLVLQRTEGPSLRFGLIVSLTILLTISLAMGLVAPGTAIENGRLRGLLENANTLAFFAFLLGWAALTLVRKRLLQISLFSLSALVLILTASRASTIALLVVVFVLFIKQGFLKSMGALFLICLVAIVAFTLVPALSQFFENLVRFNDSRSQSTATALAAFRESPLIGVGLGNESAIIASSPFRALAQAGIFGLMAVFIMWGTFIVQGLRHGVAMTSLALAAVAHSLVEGWLLSPVSPLLAIFVFFWISAEQLLSSRTTTLVSSLTDSTATRRSRHA